MKKIFFLFFIFTSIFCFSQKGVKKVLENMKTQELAWNNGDINGFMNYYWNNDSLKFIGSRGITCGWQKTLNNYLTSYPNKEAMGVLTFTIKEATQLSKKNIFIIGQWALKKDKPVGGHFTLLWKKINGKWLIIADHTS